MISLLGHHERLCSRLKNKKRTKNKKPPEVLWFLVVGLLINLAVISLGILLNMMRLLSTRRVSTWYGSFWKKKRPRHQKPGSKSGRFVWMFFVCFWWDVFWMLLLLSLLFLMFFFWCLATCLHAVCVKESVSF